MRENRVFGGELRLDGKNCVDWGVVCEDVFNAVDKADRSVFVPPVSPPHQCRGRPVLPLCRIETAQL